jgi:hypothetical protein
MGDKELRPGALYHWLERRETRMTGYELSIDRHAITIKPGREWLQSMPSCILNMHQVRHSHIFMQTCGIWPNKTRPEACEILYSMCPIPEAGHMKERRLKDRRWGYIFPPSFPHISATYLLHMCKAL